MGKDELATFNGVGFHTWQVKVKGHLMRKGLWSVITTQMDEPRGNQAQQRDFQIKDEKALGILITSVSNEIVHYLDQATTSKHAWEILEQTFGAKSKHSKISLKMQLYSLTMHENEGLSSLINRLKSICTQLSYIECNIEEDDKIAVLLKSLPLQYDNIVTVLKEKEPIPSLESIINSLQEEERKHATHSTQEISNNHALYVSSKKHFKPCTHCGKTNHLSSNCYKVKKCIKCNKVGHPPQFCHIKDDTLNANQKGKSSRAIHYTYSDEDEEPVSYEDNEKSSIHLVTSPPSPTSSSTSSSSNSNKKHAKRSSNKSSSKSEIFYIEDDIL